MHLGRRNDGAGRGPRRLGIYMKLGGLVGLLSACASAPYTTRIVETESSQVVTYGKPEGVRYLAEVDPSFEQVRVVVYRQAECAQIPVKLVERTEEKLRGNEVVERRILGKAQHAQEPTAQVICDQGYANQVDVMLEADGARLFLGRTDAQGTVQANLAQLLRAGSMGSTPTEVRILVRPNQAQASRQVGSFSLTELRRSQVRIEELISDQEELFQSGQLSQEESARAYVNHEALFQLAPGDPRVVALHRRFWELVARRKQLESVDQLRRNLDALKGAQSLLAKIGDTALPIYLQAAVQSGQLDQRSLQWSTLRLLRALRGLPPLCRAGYSFSRLSSYDLPFDVQVAAHYLEFAYSGQREALWSRACRHLF